MSKIIDSKGAKDEINKAFELDEPTSPTTSTNHTITKNDITETLSGALQNDINETIAKKKSKELKQTNEASTPCDAKRHSRNSVSQATQNIVILAQRSIGKSDSYTVSHTNEGFVESPEDVSTLNTVTKELAENIPSEIEKHEISAFEKKQETNKFDNNEKEQIKPILWTQVFGAVTGASVHLAVGAVVGFTGVMLPSMMDPTSDDLILSKDEASLFSSVVNLGGMAGSLLSSLMMVWIGQRSTLLVFLPIGMAFWITMAVSQVFWMMMLSRIVQGVVIGTTAGCANNYVVEIAHSSVRGRLASLVDLLRQVGFLFMYLVGSSGMAWRSVSLICGLISMALPFTGMIFLPHSPRWLATKGRREEARKALLFFRGERYDVDSELNDIFEQLERTAKGGTLKEQLHMLTEHSIAVRFCILAVLLFACHFTGNFAMITYSVSIFESANVSINSYLSTILAAFTRVLGVIIYFSVADKFGRRPLFMIPLFLSGVCMIALGSFFFAQDRMEDASSLSFIPLVSLGLYTLFTCMSHPVLMLMRSELLPTSVRSAGVGLLYLFFFTGSFAVAISYPYMVDSIGSHWTFWIYGATSFTMVLITAIAIPETQGKSLEEIGELFRKKKIMKGA